MQAPQELLDVLDLLVELVAAAHDKQQGEGTCRAQQSTLDFQQTHSEWPATIILTG